MAPGVERVVLDNEPGFTETSQEFAQLIRDYSKGSKEEKQERIDQALRMLDAEAGLRCPKCNSFAGGKIKKVLEEHRGRRLQMENLAAYEFKVGNVKKKDLGIESRHVYMYLLIHPKWMEGASGLDDGEELGGFADADPEMTARWFERRLEGMRFVEVRGRIRLADEEVTEEDKEEAGENEDTTEEEDAESAADRKKYGLPGEIVLADGTRIQTRTGTVPQQSHFTCQKCGKKQDILESIKPTKHTAPMAAYALQCHCPQCDAEGYNYNGRYFKQLEPGDVKRLILAEREWADRNEADLNEYWPRNSTNPYPPDVRDNDSRVQNMDRWHYDHWWKMFNPRQLLVHTQLMRAITDAPEDQWQMDVREQALGALQQYLRNQNMFVFWNPQRDTPEPMFSNANFHPKQQTIENCVFHVLGRGNWQSSSVKVIEAMEWASEPWELVVVSEDGVKKKSEKAIPQDPVNSGAGIYCGSSTDLSMLNGTPYDLVITDPPFGNNLFYADLADFFYVWMRLPLLKWYRGMPERKYFEPERTPHSLEIVENIAEHPDDREDYERERFVTNSIIATVRELTGNKELGEKDPNPLNTCYLEKICQ